MLGSIVGDIVGSGYEIRGGRSEEFLLVPEGATFTDDTVLTVATADAVLRGRPCGETYRAWGRRYPEQGSPEGFPARRGARYPKPFSRAPNGPPMRVCPIGWAFPTLQEVLAQTERSAAVTHDHPGGTRGALAEAGCVFLARSRASRAEIRAFLRGMIGYRVERSVAELRSTRGFDASSQEAVPEALTAFLESEDFEDALRKALSLGGGAHTRAAIAGGVAEAFYGGVPAALRREALTRLTPEMLVVLKRFERRFGDGADRPVAPRPGRKTVGENPFCARPETCGAQAA
ncbi:MAG: ADP-ribosylglycohydrolase family protein [Deltaproteobacteria bacterium]|nr:ADP-ribosylglycohydrolase family protein [Deltaproteobacteria bacterium]